jgi:hypothetical protein
MAIVEVASLAEWSVGIWFGPGLARFHIIGATGYGLRATSREQDLLLPLEAHRSQLAAQYFQLLKSAPLGAVSSMCLTISGRNRCGMVNRAGPFESLAPE